MKVEHKLSERELACVRRAMEQSNIAQQNYLAALGQAHDMLPNLHATKQAIGHTLQTIIDLNGLPPSVKPYELSPDGTTLTGETQDGPPPSAQLPATVDAKPTKEVRVNGSAA